MLAQTCTQLPHETQSIGTHLSSVTFTKREQEVLTGVARGERSKEIGARLGITERTVRAYLNSIFAKLGVDSRASAVAVAMKNNLLPKDE